jgi:hypothetical protein
MMVISFASIAKNIGNQFYLWNGGFTLPNVNYRDSFIRIANKEHPPYNLYQVRIFTLIAHII